MINNIKQSVQRSECRHIIKIKIKVIIDIYLLKKKKKLHTNNCFLFGSQIILYIFFGQIGNIIPRNICVYIKYQNSTIRPQTAQYARTQL